MKPLLASVLVFLITSVASAMVRSFTVLEMAEECEVAFTGTVTRVDQETATVEVGQVLRGKLDGPSVVVTPTSLRGCVGSYPNIKAGESSLFFAKVGKPVTIVCDGAGKIVLDPKTSDLEIAAAKRLLEVAALKDEDAKNLAMLGETGSASTKLRAEALRYISGRLANSKLCERYKDKLAVLLRSDDPQVQRAVLDGLRFVKAEEIAPRMIALSRSQDLSVVQSASLALAHYDTPEAVAARIALTTHQEPGIRCRACLDLSSSRRPEAKAALAAMLDDKASEVRATAPTGLVYLLRSGKADDLLPRLALLLKDPDDQVRARTAYAMGETRNVRAIAPLLEVLQTEGISREVKYFTLGALYCHYSKDDATAKPLLDKHIDLFIAALKDDTSEAGFGPSFHAVGILSLCELPEAKAALEWAATSHPNPEIRGYAQRSLGGR